MRLRFSEAEESFRAEVVALLEEHRELGGYFHQGERWPAVKAFFRELGERGWLSLTWPEQAGGLGRSLAHEYILWDEAAHARAARNPLSAGIVARTLIRHGTAEQQARWLPPIRSGELHFSLGYSEPEAGSDLAGLRTRAERQGDRYVVSGQKCWQSYGLDADALWLLCRTGAPDSRGAGLSLLIVEMDSPGLQVAPIPMLDDHCLSEIHLHEVEVPVTQRVGPENGAWPVVADALADERHIQFVPKRVRRDFEDALGWLHEQGLAQEPVVHERLLELAVDVEGVELHALRVLDAMQRGRSGAVEAAANKVVHTEVCQRIARTLLDFGGPSALLRGGPEFLWRQSLWETIGGGTSEVMRGVVARQGLGLGARRSG